MGNVLLVGITVVITAGLFVIIMNLDGPAEVRATRIEPFVLPTAPDTLVIEHRGGEALPISDLIVLTDLDATQIRTDLADRLDALDPAWSVTGSDGGAKTSTDWFGVGDQIRYTSASILGKEMTVGLFDTDSGALSMHVVRLQAGDVAGPILSAAKTKSTTSIELTFDEPLGAIQASDFTVTGVTVQAAEIIGTGKLARLTTTAFGSSATPTVSTKASPTGTNDLAGHIAAGSVSVGATDGAPPAITVGPVVTPTSTGATVLWTTDEAGDSAVDFGTTSGLGRSVLTAALTTTHSSDVLSLTPSTLYYYRVRSTDAAGNERISATDTFTTLPAPTNIGPSFSGIRANVLYSTTQGSDRASRVALNVINPTDTARQVDLVRFSVSPILGTGDKAFFRGSVDMGPGSDPEFACTWTPPTSNTITCDPPGTFTLPAHGMKQVVMTFRTVKDPFGAHTVLTGEVVLTGPSETVRDSVNVQHMSGAAMLELLPLTGAGGDRRGGFHGVAGGASNDFHYRFTMLDGSAKFRTRFIIPAGWESVSVPSQSALDHVSAIVRQPTSTSFGYVDVMQDMNLGNTREIYIRATPPSGTSAFVMEIDTEGSKEGASGNGNYFINLLWVGVDKT